MVHLIPALLAALWAGIGVYLPHPADKDGIGLRVCNLSDCGPYLVGEILSPVRFNVTLVNHSKATLEHDPFVIASRALELVVFVTDPDGKRVQPLVQRHAWPPRPSFTVPCKLRPGECATLDFHFKEFGRLGLSKPGRHRIEATWTIDGRIFTSPPVEFVVVAVPPNAVLVSHAVPLEGRGAKESSRPVIQQVPVGNRTLLIYRCHYDPAQTGGGAYFTTRVAELPGKCEMKVEGAFGDWKPLTITYKDANSATGTTKLVINSLDGRPWTEEEEQLLREREAARIAPAPRSVKP